MLGRPSTTGGGIDGAAPAWRLAAAKERTQRDSELEDGHYRQPNASQRNFGRVHGLLKLNPFVVHNDHAQRLGRRYASELARRRNRIRPYDML